MYSGWSYSTNSMKCLYEMSGMLIDKITGMCTCMYIIICTIIIVGQIMYKYC